MSNNKQESSVNGTDVNTLDDNDKANDTNSQLVNGEAWQDELAVDNRPTDVGSTCVVMRLWEGQSATNRPMWLTEPPRVEEEEKSISEDHRYAITLLHRPIEGTSTQALDTIVIRNPDLHKFLEDTIPNVSAFYNESEQGITIRSPFRLLFWYLDYIDAAVSGSDTKLRGGAELLQGVLRDEFRDVLAKRSELVSRHEINFKILWTLFKPGITCLVEYANDIVAVKVSSIHFSTNPMGQSYYRIKHITLGWDGECFGWVDSYTDIMDFPGRQKINNLDIFPAEFHDDPNVLVSLISRGRKFVGIAVKEPHMMSFSGEALDREASPMWWQGEQKKKMSERVVLDARAYNHYYRKVPITRLKTRPQMLEALKTYEYDDSIFLYCSPEYLCFALQRKKWVRVWIDDITETVFNDSAYPSLVLPKDYKELLLAFAEAQIDTTANSFDDVIAGKGQGILMLLAGSPGTGKTLTAEAMAEHMKRPLYSVSAGELGAAAGGMENELDRVLELSTRWNAVLLLDEADVFLEKRTENDLKRNSIVSIFLRKLEYYRGIMFLTTNRASSFDEAFKSRIHVSIRYPDLDASARRTIWTNFLKKAGEIYSQGVEVDAQQLDELSAKALNGREIRNIVKSAQLLASRTKQPLRKSHLDTVWKVEHEDSAWR